MVIHVVNPGESIYSIARLYKVSPDKIASDNELDKSESLVIGQTIVILEGIRSHKVVQGESVYTISREYRVPIADILRANPNLNPRQLQPGMVINIPPTTRKLGTIDINGYALPDIDMNVLRKTLPYLTYFCIFSYDASANGNLKAPNDVPLIQAARAANVAPIMVVTNIKEGGGFDSDLVRTLLTNETAQQALINNILGILKSKNYYGLNIDFEYIYPEDKEKYNAFLKKMSSILKSQGYKLMTSLAPKTSAAKAGLLYVAHDYPVHGTYADHVILMTYEWGYIYGPPLAVAPINEVRKVLDYAVTAIPRQKILMGMPNYGYDWKLPYVSGTSAKTVTNVGAVDLARKEGAIIRYDRKSQSPYFEYYDDNKKKHIVWFEDARSIEAKLRLVNNYRIGGASYWTINKFFPQNWLVLQGLYDIRKVL